MRYAIPIQLIAQLGPVRETNRSGYRRELVPAVRWASCPYFNYIANPVQTADEDVGIRKSLRQGLRISAARAHYAGDDNTHQPVSITHEVVQKSKPVMRK